MIAELQIQRTTTVTRRPRHFNRMKGGWRTKFILYLTLCLPALASPTRERFDEQLTIKSLRDGKVASKFSFKTILQGISPRNPETLGNDDVCASFQVHLTYIGSLTYRSPALYSFPFGFGSDP